MKLSQLLKYVQVKEIIGNTDVEINGICTDSRSVKEGDLFICYAGGKYDSHRDMLEITTFGAVAVICEKKLDCPVTQIIVKDGRAQIARVAQAFYNFPDKKLKITGVTGTNGKTTTCHMLSSIYKANGNSVGVIGTLGISYCGKFIAPELTTPDPVFLYSVLADMAECGVEYVFMEVSAHALYYDKIYGIEFETAVFTNCTQDHLDFFGNMHDYAAAKKLMFKSGRYKNAVINSDDDLGVALISSVKNAVTYGLKNPADVFAVDINESVDGTTFVLNLTTVSGRLEKVAKFNGADIFVDFAHTPDGLEKSLQSLKKLCKGKLYCLFGCGGNRDRSKRPIMGETAAKYSDFCIVTSDNPRFEDPYDIISEIETGIKKTGKKYVTVTEREIATEYAIWILEKNDILLVAGKGGEDYQEIMGIKHSYNDNTVIKNIIGD